MSRPVIREEVDYKSIQRALVRARLLQPFGFGAWIVITAFTELCFEMPQAFLRVRSVEGTNLCGTLRNSLL